MKTQEFRFVQTDRPSAKTHTLAVYVTYPLKESLVGLIEWHGVYYGYAFTACSGLTCLTQNVMGEIALALHSLNAGEPCKYIELNDF